jgi:hypothetical protein
MVKHNDLQIKIFADGADIEGIRTLRSNPLIKGLPNDMCSANTISLDSFICQQMHSLDAETLSYPNFGNLVPSLIVPSVAFSAVVIGCMDFRQQRIMKRMLSVYNRNFTCS